MRPTFLLRSLVNCPSCLSRAVNFAPAGKPEAIPIAHANPPTPGTLNNGLISGSNITPINVDNPKSNQQF